MNGYVSAAHASGKSVGFVPTMGALHEGHLSLISRAKLENNLVVCSIFVNPAQFNDPSDLEKYPRPIEKDIELLLAVGCDVLFLPGIAEVYPNGLDGLNVYDLGHLERYLEGASRPGHFMGVANVLERFLRIIRPERLYLGQKDFQQVKVVERLIDITGFNTHIIICPILREANGLAMSSRNIRLSTAQRDQSSLIYKTLLFANEHFRQYTPKVLKQEMISIIESMPETRVDYLEFCDTKTFRSIENWNDAEHIVAVTAVKVGSVRLLDNILLQ